MAKLLEIEAREARLQVRGGWGEVPCSLQVRAGEEGRVRRGVELEGELSSRPMAQRPPLTRSPPPPLQVANQLEGGEAPHPPPQQQEDIVKIHIK